MTLAGQGGEKILANLIVKCSIITFCGTKILAIVNFTIKSTRGQHPVKNLRETSSRLRIFLVSLVCVYRNPRLAGSQSIIFLISLVYACIYVFIYLCMYLCHVSWPNEKRYRPEIWYTYSNTHHLNTHYLRAPSLEKPPCHVIFRIFSRQPCVCFHSFVCVMPPGQTKKDTDLKIDTQVPLDPI